MNSLHNTLAAGGFGMLNAYCLMVFCLLYIPCFATLATIRRESSSWKFTALTAVQLLVAWFVSFVIFQVGSLL